MQEKEEEDDKAEREEEFEEKEREVIFWEEKPRDNTHGRI